MKTSIRVAEVGQESPLQASKWLKVQLLVGPEQMQSLFASLGEFEIYMTGKLTEKGRGGVPQLEFLNIYRDYIHTLMDGQLPDERQYGSYFSSVISASQDALYRIYTPTDQQLIRVSKPVIQMQAHTLDYSSREGKIRSMVFGVDSIPWGLQFSYPQLYLEGNKTVQVLHEVNYPNTALFKQLQEWVRKNTVPTPFEIAGEKLNLPVRLGKECFPWINRNPRLQNKGLKVIIPDTP